MENRKIFKNTYLNYRYTFILIEIFDNKTNIFNIII